MRLSKGAVNLGDKTLVKPAEDEQAERNGREQGARVLIVEGVGYGAVGDGYCAGFEDRSPTADHLEHGL